MTNRYAGRCACGAHVRAGAGVVERDGKRWRVSCGDCSAGLVSNVVTTSGGTFYRNKRGRCEDAPCCGCCTY